MQQTTGPVFDCGRGAFLVFLSCLCVLVSLCALARGASGARGGARFHRVPHLFRGCSSSRATRAARVHASIPLRVFPFPSLFLVLCLSICFSLSALSLFSSSSRSHSRGFARRGASSVALSSDKFARFATFVSLFPRLCVLLFASLFPVASVFTPLRLSSRCRLLVSESSLCLLRLFVLGLGPARDAASGFGSLGNS